MEVAEGVGDDLIETAAESGFTELVGKEFEAVGASDGGGANGEFFWDQFVAVYATKFFDKVFFAENVDTPGGGLNFEGIWGDSEDGEAEFGEILHGLFDSDGHTEELAGAPDEKGERDGFRLGRIDIDHASDRFFPSDFGIEFGKSVQGGDDTFGIDRSLEPVTGFGKESELGAGFANGSVDEVSGFKEAARGGCGDFCFFAAHDSCETDCTVGVSDDHVVRL